MTRAPGRISLPQALMCAVVFAVVALAVAWPSLDYDWHWDDLHLIRPFSAAEIARSFAGDWDPDGVETKGFRPGTVVFNDLRARVFGESTRAHRFFLIALYSAYLVLLAALVCRFGGPWWAGLIAGVLTLCAKDSLYHYVWISDGIHLLPGLLFIAAAHLLLTYLDTGRRTLGVGSALLILAALATREDSLALYIVLPAIGLSYSWFLERPRESYVRLAGYAGVLLLTFFPFWLWRLAVIPRAPNFRVNSGVALGPLTLFQWTVCLSGQSGSARYAFMAAFVVLVVIAARLPRDMRRQCLMWLALAAIACMPGAVRVVSNLLFFPISFYATFAALTLGALTRRSPRAASLAVVLFAVAAVTSATASRLEQLSMHSRSTGKIYRDWEGIYSKIRFASIPPARAERTKASLARFGIVDITFDFDRWQADLRQQGRVGFVDDDGPFVPEKYFLTP